MKSNFVSSKKFSARWIPCSNIIQECVGCLRELGELRVDKAEARETIHKGFLNPQTKCKLFFLLCVQNKSQRRGTALTEFSFFTNRATWTWRGIKKYFQCFFLFWFLCSKCCTWPEKVWQKDSALKETNFTPFSPPACLDGQGTIEHLRIFQPRTLLIWMSQKVPPDLDENIEDHPKSDPKGRKDRRERQLNGNPLWTARIVKAREKLPSILLSDGQLQFS